MSGEYLRDYATGEVIGPATGAQIDASDHAERRNGVGAFIVDADTGEPLHDGADAAVWPHQRTVYVAPTVADAVRCACGNVATDDDGRCDWCAAIADEPAHTGHYSRLSGTYWCDTCDSPLCDLA